MGPYSLDQIRTFLSQNLIGPADNVLADGWADWLPIGSVPGLVETTQTDEVHVLGSGQPTVQSDPEGLNWLCVWMHLSQFTAFVTLLAGYALPLLIWQTNRHSHPMVDRQGRIIMNWIISSLIYDLLAIALCVVAIGFLICPVLFAVEIIFPIVGAVKASKGEAWVYPLSIPFFKV